MTTTPTELIADFVHRVQPEHLPEPVQDEATRSLVNILGCVIAGAHHPSVKVALAALSPFAGPDQATIIGHGRRADIVLASQLNAMSANAYMFDDTHAEAIVHPSAPVFGSLLAIGERDRLSGRTFLTAMTLGIEIMCRLSKALMTPPAQPIGAWIQTAITGGIGAAVATGKALGLGKEALVHAIGIAAAQACGFRAVSGSMCSPLLTGHAAEVGMKAALLAARGYQSVAEAIDAKDGFAQIYSGRPNLHALTYGLGTHFEIRANTYKPYPCGIVIHPIIEACIALHERHHLAADRIIAVEIFSNPVTSAMTSRRHPTAALEAQVSLHHWAASALIAGEVNLNTAGAFRDPQIAALRDKLVVHSASEIPRTGARVTVTLPDSQKLEQIVPSCIGSADRPMTNDDLSRKFLTLATSVIGRDRAQTLLSQCWNVAHLSDIGDIARAMACPKKGEGR